MRTVDSGQWWCVNAGPPAVTNTPLCGGCGGWGGGCMCGWLAGIRQLSVPSPQFCYEPKITLKNKISFKNFKRCSVTLLPKLIRNHPGLQTRSGRASDIMHNEVSQKRILCLHEWHTGYRVQNLNLSPCANLLHDSEWCHANQGHYVQLHRPGS